MIVDPFHFDFLFKEVENGNEEIMNLCNYDGTVMVKRRATATMTLMEVICEISV